MQFDFSMFKATLLLYERRLGEAEQALRHLMGTKLTPAQSEQAERVLDAIHLSVVASLDQAGRQLQLLLHRYHAEHGKYPSELSLDGLSGGDPTVQRDITGSLSGIEDYRATGEAFSVVVVGKDGRTRRRVTERGIEAER